MNNKHPFSEEEIEKYHQKFLKEVHKKIKKDLQTEPQKHFVLENDHAETYFEETMDEFLDKGIEGYKIHYNEPHMMREEWMERFYNDDGKYVWEYVNIPFEEMIGGSVRTNEEGQIKDINIFTQ